MTQHTHAPTGRAPDRYQRDQHHPRIGGALLDLLLRVILPGGVILGIVVLVGKLVVRDEIGREEETTNKDLQGDRTTLANQVTKVWSHMGNTEIVIGCCVIIVAILLWKTRQWWVALIPAIAISIQSTIFVLATMLANRPRPQVSHLDPAPPTSSYPSGHMGASTALWGSVFLLAGRIDHPVGRRLLRAVCVLIPGLVGFARLYRGMHHPIDVAVGLGLGLACCALAWFWLRREKHAGEAEHAEHAA